MGTIFNEGLSPELLEEMFHSDEKCYWFLADLKWGTLLANPPPHPSMRHPEKRDAGKW